MAKKPKPPGPVQQDASRVVKTRMVPDSANTMMIQVKDDPNSRYNVGGVGRPDGTGRRVGDVFMEKRPTGNKKKVTDYDTGSRTAYPKKIK